VSDPEEWVSLLFFLLTAMVTGQLAAGQRERAHEAQQREREAVVLYDVVRLLGEGNLDQVLGAVAERLRLEPHSGRVWVENRAGGGARFTFTLPLTEAPTAVSPAESSASVA